MVYTKEQLKAQWLEVYELGDDEEMDFDSWYEMLMQIKADIEEKAEATAMIIKNYEADASAIMAEAERLTKRANALMNKADWCKKSLYRMMKETGNTKFKTDHFSFNIQQNGGKAPIVIDEGITTDDVAPEFIKWGKPSIDKEAIREALESGQDIPYARIGERGDSLRIR